VNLITVLSFSNSTFFATFPILPTKIKVFLGEFFRITQFKFKNNYGGFNSLLHLIQCAHENFRRKHLLASRRGRES